MKRWFLYVGLALFVGAFVNCGVVEGGTTKFFSPGFKLWGSYHYLSMSDWNSYKEYVDDERMAPGQEYYSSFHHGFVLGGEFSCLFMDMWGFGLGTGLILGKGAHRDDTRDGGDREQEWRVEYEFKHSAKAFPLMFTLYFTPRVSLFRFVLGGGTGFYHAQTNFDWKDTYYHSNNYIDGDWSYNYHYRISNLSSNGLGLHGSVGLEIKIPETPIAIFAEGKSRNVKISGFKGKENMSHSWEIYTPEYGYKSGEGDTITSDVKLKYAEDDDGDEYFGPMSEEMEEWYDYYGEVRDGIIDFSGFEFGIGISFRF